MKHCDARALWRAHLAAQQASGLSINHWCAVNGIRRTLFYRWKEKLNRYDNIECKSDVLSPATQIMPVKPLHNKDNGWLSVEDLPVEEISVVTLRVGRVTIDVVPGFDRHLLKDVLTVLEAI